MSGRAGGRALLFPLGIRYPLSQQLPACLGIHHPPAPIADCCLQILNHFRVSQDRLCGLFCMQCAPPITEPVTEIPGDFPRYLQWLMRARALSLSGLPSQPRCSGQHPPLSTAPHHCQGILSCLLPAAVQPALLL